MTTRICTKRINVTKSYRLYPGKLAIVIRQIGGYVDRDPRKDYEWNPLRTSRKAERRDTRAKYAVRSFAARR